MDKAKSLNNIPLDLAPINSRVKVVKILGGWGIRQRLGQLGVHPGDVMLVKRSGALGGPIMVNIHNADVALGRGMARKVLVQCLL